MCIYSLKIIAFELMLSPLLVDFRNTRRKHLAGKEWRKNRENIPLILSRAGKIPVCIPDFVHIVGIVLEEDLQVATGFDVEGF